MPWQIIPSRLVGAGTPRAQGLLLVPAKEGVSSRTRSSDVCYWKGWGLGHLETNHQDKKNVAASFCSCSVSRLVQSCGTVSIPGDYCSANPPRSQFLGASELCEQDELTLSLCRFSALRFIVPDGPLHLFSPGKLLFFPAGERILQVIAGRVFWSSLNL